ncbi:hypothetical protein EB796_005708 [Bugula neritina]|uniref:Uncharacterized protein n=1 Tax=Bugula neritina TaxID=10212 RepID=A0A7J7KCT1_BUGNE|nr:hypothetical protein EB796_005708 [Bugula neritina]
MLVTICCFSLQETGFRCWGQSSGTSRHSSSTSLTLSLLIVKNIYLIFTTECLSLSFILPVDYRDMIIYMHWLSSSGYDECDSLSANNLYPGCLTSRLLMGT